MKPLCHILGLLLTVSALTACQPEAHKQTQTAASQPVAASQEQLVATEFLGSDIRNENIGGNVSLIDHNNQRMNLMDDTDKVKVVFFGYTHCPDICPTNLLTYNDALSMLGDDAKNVQVYFITIDPERDTPEHMKNYVTVFNETFVGLWPSTNSELAQIKKDWQVTATKVPRDDGLYFMDHSTGTYLLNRQNQATVYEPHGVDAKQIAHDLKLLLKSNS